jgi:hypothetical protein
VKHRLPVGIPLPEKQFTLHFDDVRVPASCLIGDEHAGFRQVFDVVKEATAIVPFGLPGEAASSVAAEDSRFVTGQTIYFSRDTSTS